MCCKKIRHRFVSLIQISEKFSRKAKFMFEVVARKNSKTKEADLYLYGDIGRWGRVTSRDFIDKISSLVQDGNRVINCFINSPGGAVFERLGQLLPVTVIGGLYLELTLTGWLLVLCPF